LSGYEGNREKRADLEREEYLEIEWSVGREGLGEGKDHGTRGREKNESL